jgi:hypothetical protein
MDDDNPLPQQRAGLLSWHLAHGEAFTLNQAARIVRMRPQYTRALLFSLAHVIPIGAPDGVLWQRTPGRPRLMGYTHQQRAALLAWYFASGAMLTTQQAARLTGLARNSAYVLLDKLSCVLPLYCERQVWCVLDRGPEEHLSTGLGCDYV